MRKIIVLFLLASCSMAYADTTDFAETFAGDTKTVTLSTTVASPTQIGQRNPVGIPYYRTWIVNTSSCAVAISTISTNVNWASTYQIPGVGTAGNAPVIWSPDGIVEPYEGPIYAVSGCSSTTPTLSIFRVQ